MIILKKLVQKTETKSIFKIAVFEIERVVSS